jgi:hypothetical protein
MISDGYRAGVSDPRRRLNRSRNCRPTSSGTRPPSEREHYREVYLRTLEQCRKLELELLGQKSERLSGNDAQLTMAVLATLLGERPATIEPMTSHPIRCAGRSRAKPTGPEHLPRVDVEIVPDEVAHEGRPVA